MLRPGISEKFTGDVTTLNWIGARSPGMIEAALGFRAGRLAAGYWVVVLTEKLNEDDFEFAGTTMRSGGRFGLPGSTSAADKARPRVHDAIVTERGEDGYKALQKKVLTSVSLTGPKRIAKVVPVTRHDPNLAPDLQYPMGGGGLQWKLVKPKEFLVAMEVTPAGEAKTPTFTVSLSNSLPAAERYDNRAKLARYLETA